MNKPSSAFVSTNPPSPPSDQPVERVTANLPKAKKKFGPIRARENFRMGEATDPVESPKFAKRDWDELYENVPLIQKCTVAKYLQGWDLWAKNTPQSAEQWRTYYEKKVMPQWEKDHGNEQTATTSTGELSTRPEAQKSTRSEAPQVENATPLKKSGFRTPPSPNFLRAVDAIEDGKAVSSENVETESSESHALLVEKLAKERQGKLPMKAYKFFVENNMDIVMGVDSSDFSELFVTAGHVNVLADFYTYSCSP
jgi:hypothetical protein